MLTRETLLLRPRENITTLGYTSFLIDFPTVYNELFSPLLHNILLYIDRNLYTLRRKFALAWTNQLRHFGYTSTSRIEGMHSQIKKYVVSSRQDLLGVCTALNYPLRLN
jgi:hypothetical protein